MPGSALELERIHIEPDAMTSRCSILLVNSLNITIPKKHLDGAIYLFEKGASIQEFPLFRASRACVTRLFTN